MSETVTTVLETLGEQKSSFHAAASLAEDTELEVKFIALEALSELDRPRTVRAMREVLRIFVD